MLSSFPGTKALSDHASPGRAARESNRRRKLARELAERLMQELDGEIHAVILYGSVARNEATDESDIDLLVLARHAKDIGRKIRSIRDALDAEHGYLTFLSTTTKTSDQIRRLIEIGTPIIRNILSEGIVLYDDGTFESFRKKVLARIGNYMAMKPTRAFARLQLAEADRMLVDARIMLDNESLSSAADRAYYAIFNAALAALSQEPALDHMPHTHSGLHTLFVRYLTSTNRVPSSLAADLGQSFKLRQTATYNWEEGPTGIEILEIEEAAVVDMVGKAEAFVAAMRQLLGMEESGT